MLFRGTVLWLMRVMAQVDEIKRSVAKLPILGVAVASEALHMQKFST